jgi:F-type H+-transporting ATPase subunit beta
VPARLRNCALECRRLLTRLRELCPKLTREEIDALSGEDRHTAERAMKLQRYLTQPFNISEHFLGMPAETVPIQQTLEDCRAILDGRLDGVPDKHIMYTGALDQILARAATSSA